MQGEDGRSTYYHGGSCVKKRRKTKGGIISHRYKIGVDTYEKEPPAHMGKEHYVNIYGPDGNTRKCPYRRFSFSSAGRPINVMTVGCGGCQNKCLYFVGINKKSVKCKCSLS